MGELTTVLDLLNSTADTDKEPLVLCDLQYAINSLTTWFPGWKHRGWEKGGGEPVLNTDLMKQFDRALQNRRVRFEWVKGHTGHPLNEAADERVCTAATAYRDGTPVAQGSGFPGAGKKPALPELLRDDASEQLALFKLPGEWA